MPTYEYKCTKCDFYFEKFQRITEEPLSDCPKEGCGGTVQRLFSSGAGLIFKGSGFYGTDYRSESYKKAASADSTSTTASPSKGTSSGADTSTAAQPSTTTTGPTSSSNSTPASTVAQTSTKKE